LYSVGRLKNGELLKNIKSMALLNEIICFKSLIALRVSVFVFCGLFQFVALNSSAELLITTWSPSTVALSWQDGDIRKLSLYCVL